MEDNVKWNVAQSSYQTGPEAQAGQDQDFSI